MNKFLYSLFALGILLVASCTSNTPEQEKVTMSKEATALSNINALKNVAASGDLIVRLSDDLISERVKYLNEKDFSYSHAGLIIEKDNTKYVCHIAPEAENADTIQFTPIDSFINPQKDLSCALYRYNFSEAEKHAVSAAIENYRRMGVKFDRVYDLVTNERLYCSEMISKALKIATGNRIVCHEINVPVRMRPIVASYFMKEQISKKTVAERKIITVDNLYSMPECSLVMKFQLKTFPG